MIRSTSVVAAHDAAPGGALAPEWIVCEASARSVVDGVVVQVDQMFQLERLGYTTLIDMRKLAFNYPTQGIITSRTALRTKRESLKSFLKVYLEAIKILKTERELPIRAIG